MTRKVMNPQSNQAAYRAEDAEGDAESMQKTSITKNIGPFGCR